MPSNKPWSYDRTRWTRLYNSTNGVQGLGLRETDRRYYLNQQNQKAPCTGRRVGG
jgi:hypothetical protein